MFNKYPVLDKIRQLRVNNNEFAQSFARNTFTLFITIYLSTKQVDQLALLACYIYLIFGVVVSLQIYFESRPKPLRKWLMMVLDVGATSLAFSLTAQYSGIFIGVYLWLILGYGLRYGSNLFVGTFTTALIGFLISTNGNAYWQAQQDLKYGFLITMVLIPIYTLKLLLNFEEEKRKANAANQAKSAFLSHISHEIRTPLNGVVVGSELLLQTKQDKKQKDLTRMMHASAVSLKKLITDVLDISKIEQGKVELEQVRFNLKASVEHVYEVFQLEASRKGLALNLHIEPEADQYFEGSVGHIEQVLMNLVANAIKFTDHGSVDLFVSTKVTTEHLKQIEFKIKDTGIGMSTSALSHIFDAFKQADSSITRKYGGTGLGTSIAKQLVNMMGGDITVTSALGVGSLFTVTLSLKQAQPEIDDNETQTLTPVSEVQDNIVKLSTHHKFSKKTRVLIADDNVINRMILIEVLQKNGCVVKAVNDGAEALDALEMHQFDMMILDYNMPEHTGLEVFKIYHTLAGAKPVRSVILTADATAKTRDECLDAGVYSVFTKPIVTKQINQLIKTYQQERDNADALEKSDLVESDIATADIKQMNAKVRLVDASVATYVEPLIDQQRMAHLIKLGNGESFLIKLITEFIEATDSAVTALSEECAELNFEKIHELAHSLAGESANVGLMPLSKHCRTLMNLTILDTQSIREKLSNVERTYIQTRAQLQAMLKTLSAKRSNN